MYETWYERISSRFEDPGAARLLRIADKALVYIVAVAFVGTATWLAATGNAGFVRFVCVPAATFVIATVLRAAINAPRPYERFRIRPVLDPDTRGKSLPSRHVESAAAIACAFLWLNPVAGIVAWIAAAAIACVRVIGGVHFPHDVFAAVALAIACAAIGFLAIP